MRRSIARTLSASTLRSIPLKTTTFARVTPIYRKTGLQPRTFSLGVARLAEDRASATTEAAEDDVVKAEAEELGHSSQEIAATSESTDQVPEDSIEAQSTADTSSSLDAAQETAATSESTDQVPDTNSGIEAAQEIAATTTSTDQVPQQSRRAQQNADADNFVFVGGFSYDATVADLQEYFAPAGNVSSVRIIFDQEGRSKGFGFVHFEDAASVAKAVEQFNRSEMHRRTLTVTEGVKSARNRREPRAPRPNHVDDEIQPSKTLFIGNMSFQMSDNDLNDLFKDIKNVLDVRVAIDRRSGQPRGFAHADFVDVEDAKTAKKHLERIEIYGRQIRVSYANPSGVANPRN